MKDNRRRRFVSALQHAIGIGGRPPLFDQFEPRQLLTADPAAFAHFEGITQPNAPAEILLTLSPSNASFRGGSASLACLLYTSDAADE